jgi:hypothetical protein
MTKQVTNQDYLEYARQFFVNPEEVRKAERELAERLKWAQLAKTAREALQAAGLKVLSKTYVNRKSYGVNTNTNPLQMM